MDAQNGRISVIHIVVFTFVLSSWFFISSFSCSDSVMVPTEQQGAASQEIKSLDDKIQPPPSNSIDLTPTATGEDVFLSRCSTCHEPDYHINKYHGEQWEMVIGRMIKKEGALFTPQLAEKVYQYLYDRTKHPDDPPFEEVVKGRSHFEYIGDGDGVGAVESDSNADDSQHTEH